MSSSLTTQSLPSIAILPAIAIPPATQANPNPSAPSSKTKLILQKVWQAAQIIFKVALAAFLYWSTPTLFAIGIVVGVVAPDHMKAAIQKIKNIMSNQPFIICAIVGFGCFLSLPVTLATGAVIFAGHIGSNLSTAADEKLERTPANAIG